MLHLPCAQMKSVNQRRATCAEHRPPADRYRQNGPSSASQHATSQPRSRHHVHDSDWSAEFEQATSALESYLHSLDLDRVGGVPLSLALAFEQIVGGLVQSRLRCNALRRSVYSAYDAHVGGAISSRRPPAYNAFTFAALLRHMTVVFLRFAESGSATLISPSRKI
ncbi:hypothetical protein CC86DRAFT_53250 [Ophiobolus disseminans]|uniref:Uncharacterized protein n=1 Tax=Ophiobolus disseminans TaxID=1469910 RepID=A0A6A6ZTZ7_9PLEO|nr:hypothetical protein CC86DRAFT_53250 [Ophiobolus disseminans]